MCLAGPGPQKHATKKHSTPGQPKTASDMARETTFRTHSFHRHRKTDTGPHSRTLWRHSPGRIRRHKTHIEPRHTTVMVDQDTHRRIVGGGVIPNRGPPTTTGDLPLLVPYYWFHTPIYWFHTPVLSNSKQGTSRGDLLVPYSGMEPVDHLGKNQRVTGNTIRSWRLSHTQVNLKDRSCLTCLVWKQTICDTCGQLRCDDTDCRVSKEQCPTCHETNTSTPHDSWDQHPIGQYAQERDTFRRKRRNHHRTRVEPQGNRDESWRNGPPNGPKYSVQSCH